MAIENATQCGCGPYEGCAICGRYIRRPGAVSIAKRLAAQNPSWTQEKVEAEAKRIFIEQQRNGER
jgi:hypothetical protein